MVQGVSIGWSPDLYLRCCQLAREVLGDTHCKCSLCQVVHMSHQSAKLACWREEDEEEGVKDNDVITTAMLHTSNNKRISAGYIFLRTRQARLTQSHPPPHAMYKINHPNSSPHSHPYNSSLTLSVTTLATLLTLLAAASTTSEATETASPADLPASAPKATILLCALATAAEICACTLST